MIYEHMTYRSITTKKHLQTLGAYGLAGPGFTIESALSAGLNLNQRTLYQQSQRRVANGWCHGINQ